MSISDAKLRARRLHDFVTTKLNIKMSHAQALEATAAMDMDSDWNTYVACLKTETVETPKPDIPEVHVCRTSSEIVLNTVAIPAAIEGLLAYCCNLSIPLFRIYRAKNHEIQKAEFLLRNYLKKLRTLYPEDRLSFSLEKTYPLNVQIETWGKMLFNRSMEHNWNTVLMNHRAFSTLPDCGIAYLYQMLKDVAGDSMPERETMTDTYIYYESSTIEPFNNNENGFEFKGLKLGKDIDPVRNHAFYASSQYLQGNVLLLGHTLNDTVQRFIRFMLDQTVCNPNSKALWLDLGCNYIKRKQDAKLIQTEPKLDALISRLTTVDVAVKPDYSVLVKRSNSEPAVEKPVNKATYILVGPTQAETPETVLEALNTLIAARTTLIQENQVLSPLLLLITDSHRLAPAVLFDLLANKAKAANVILILQQHHWYMQLPYHPELLDPDMPQHLIDTYENMGRYQQGIAKLADQFSIKLLFNRDNLSSAQLWQLKYSYECIGFDPKDTSETIPDNHYYMHVKGWPKPCRISLY